MNDLSLNSDNDIELDAVDLKTIEGEDAITQHLGQRLKTFLGEWFLDTRIGIGYFQLILKKNPDPVVVDTILKDAVINTPGVLQLLSWDLDVDNALRELTLTFRAQTSTGILNFSEVIP